MAQPCLFCKRTDREPSIEHVFPQGLGLHADLVLPRGAVCAPCNTHLGRQVDEALVHLPAVQLIRGVFQVPLANGRVVDRIDLLNGTLTFAPDGELHVEVGEHHTRWNEEGNIVARIRPNRRRSGDQMRRVARSVMKLGLNLVYMTHGANSALHSDFDPVREAVNGEPYDGYLLIEELDILRPPDLEGSLTHDVPGVPFAAALRFGGLHLIAPMILDPLAAATREWASENDYQVMAIQPKASN
jgi:hypothetical protein